MTRPILFFEDLTPGTSFDLGEFTFSESDIIEFARNYDPQPFHLDPVAAKESIFGGLCASGWHTASAAMRVIVDGMLAPEASLGSPGIDELRWLKPVFPGERLHVRVTVESATPSRSKPWMGLVRQRTQITNPRGEPVMTFTALGLFRRRPA